MIEYDYELIQAVKQSIPPVAQMIFPSVSITSPDCLMKKILTTPFMETVTSECYYVETQASRHASPPVSQMNDPSASFLTFPELEIVK